MSTPAFSAVTWRDCATPPKIVVVFSPSACARGAMDSSIWLASSRVGARISARGRRGAAPARPFAGRREARHDRQREGEGLAGAGAAAAEHVAAARESGSDAVWIGNASVRPWAASAATSGAGTPRAAKLRAPAGTETVATTGASTSGRWAGTWRSAVGCGRLRVG